MRMLIVLLLLLGFISFQQTAQATGMELLLAAAQKPFCPTGYVRVPNNSTYTSADFCVSKYIASQSGSTALSVAGVAPWVNISQSAAVTTCKANGARYDLISNAEWQTVAQNIEGVAANWSGGAVNSGQLSRGHSDNNPANTLAASSDDVSGNCSGTGQTCSSTVWDSQRRTNVLSNGNVVWDMAGNVWQSVKDTNSTNFGSGAYMSQVTSSSHTATGTVGGLTGNAKFLFGPAGDYTALNSTPYGGLGYGYLGSTNGAIARGNTYVNQDQTGVFAVTLNNTTSVSGPRIGFRCVFHP